MQIKEKAANSQRRLILLSAKYISLVFKPQYLPMMGLLALFLFTHLRMMPPFYMFMVMMVAYCFTVLLPTSLSHLYQRHQRWSILKLLSREGRMVPYAIFILSYLACYYIMNALHMPHLMSAIVIAAISVQVVCALINHWWKISTHTAAVGATAGAVTAFSVIFGFNPLWWFCILTILGGLIGTGRTLLRIHSNAEVVGGYLIGFFTALFSVLTF